MLQDSPVYAYIPAKDIGRARQFYEGRLGFVPRDELDGGVTYAFAGGTACFLYETPNAGTSKASQLFWQVADVEREVADLKARGVNPEQVPINPQAFEEAARRRVALGLIIAELARAENLQPKPAEVRALVEQEAQSYESPAEVVKWFYMQPQRLSEMEALALETNVVKWVLTKAKVLDKQVTFDELMGGAGS